MIWPAAALAILLLGFAIAYGTSLQSRLERVETNGEAGSAPHDLDG